MKPAKTTTNTPMGKPYLAIIENVQTGPQYQLWYDNGGRFVGPEKQIENAKKIALPEDQEWTIADAVVWVTQSALKEALGENIAHRALTGEPPSEQS